MKKDVIITIVGGYEDRFGEDEPTELVTPGCYYEKNGKKYLVYEESELTGFEPGTKTMLKIDKDTLTMSRNGAGGTHMVFQSGKKHLGHYETPYGSFTVSTMTDMLDIDMGETEGKISLNYFVDIDNVPQSENALNVWVREA